MLIGVINKCEFYFVIQTMLKIMINTRNAEYAQTLQVMYTDLITILPYFSYFIPNFSLLYPDFFHTFSRLFPDFFPTFPDFFTTYSLLYPDFFPTYSLFYKDFSLLFPYIYPSLFRIHFDDK